MFIGAARGGVKLHPGRRDFQKNFLKIPHRATWNHDMLMPDVGSSDNSNYGGGQRT